MALTWTATDTPSNEDVGTVAWSPELGIFAAVSATGTVAYSTDGITWTIGTAPFNRLWTSVAWSADLSMFVAVGQSGFSQTKLLTSTDGITWTARTGQSGTWLSVVWADTLSMFVAVGGTGSVQTSTDGITWTSRTAAEANSWYDVTWSSDLTLLVAVSPAGTNRVMTSSDGITWTSQSASEANGWNAVEWSSALGLFAAIAQNGTHRVMTSTDGATWTNRTAASADNWANIIWSAEEATFVALGSGYSTGNIMTSTDGVTWASSTNPVTHGRWGGSAYAPELGIFVAAGYDYDTLKYQTMYTRGFGLSPSSGNPGGGDTVTIYGNNLNGGFTSSTRVFFESGDNNWFVRDIVVGGGESTTIISHGDLPSPMTGILEATDVVVSSSTVLTCTTPIGMGVADVITTEPDLYPNANISFWDESGFTFTNPVLTSISPTTGPGTGGTVVTLTGTNFFDNNWSSGRAGVFFRSPGVGQTYATDVTYVNATTMTCVVPPHVVGGEGVVDVTLRPPRLLLSPASTGIHFSYLYSTLTDAYTYTQTWWALHPGSEIEFAPKSFAYLPLVPEPIPFAPIVTTGFPTPIRDITVTLRGMVNPNSLSTIAWFEYGSVLDIPYLHATQPQSLGDGGKVRSISHLLTQLSPDTEYIARARAYNKVGVGNGAYIAFKTASTFTDDGWVLPELPGYPNYPYPVAPPHNTGWWLSINDGFKGIAYVVEDDVPQDPRTFAEVVGFASGLFGGSPNIVASFKNCLFYPDGGYAVGTDYPTIRVFDGHFDREFATVPPTASATVPQAVISMLSVGGSIYFSTYDSGTLSTTFTGRVFSLDPSTGVTTPLGDVFTTGHLPYSLAWHQGRLWCGTHRKNPAEPGHVYFFRPDTDTSWTEDEDLTSISMGSVVSLISFQGLLYAGTMAASGTSALLLVRGTDQTYSTSDTGSGTGAMNGFLALAEFDGSLYASYWTGAASIIRVFDGSSWSDAVTLASLSVTETPIIALFTYQDVLYALGGGQGYAPVLLLTEDGSTWLDFSAFLPVSDDPTTAVPAFGVVVK